MKKLALIRPKFKKTSPLGNHNDLSGPDGGTDTLTTGSDNPKDGSCHVILINCKSLKSHSFWGSTYL